MDEGMLEIGVTNRPKRTLTVNAKKNKKQKTLSRTNLVAIGWDFKMTSSGWSLQL
jgi:hypothetical protein